jgi:APA family basic amino acid/polyamine antiporter
VHGEGFRVPFGPYLIPGTSILACLYILKDLSAVTYHVFFAWMLVSLAIYLLYSRHHSRLNKN